jgi:hypothetical protein
MAMENNLGANFLWWIGVVEDRQDPLKVGRCRVRIVGSHSENKSHVPTENLPWAQCLIPLSSSASLQIKEGDYVMGFYLDGEEEQVPVVMGILPGIPKVKAAPSEGFSDPRTDGELSSAPRKPSSLSPVPGGVKIVDGVPTRYPAILNEPTFSRLARNEKISETIIESKKSSVSTAVTAGGGSWTEPKTPYATVYPYNRVMETESGHVLEFDDTPGAERVHIYHRSGTFQEMHPDGTMVTRINNDAYEIVLSDKNILVKGKLNITSLDDINIFSAKNITIEAGLEYKVTAGAGITTLAGTSQSHTGPAGVALKGIPITLN